MARCGSRSTARFTITATSADLERRGHRYRSRTDTETIIHFTKNFGESCIERFEGMFAFAIWDGRRRRLFLARDQLGKQAAVLLARRSTSVFASEIKALLRHPAVPRKVDPVALYHYLSFCSGPIKQTLFAGIEKLRPAQTMSLTGDGATQENRYGIGWPDTSVHS